jgi:pilus assembly protein CpaF
MAELMVASLDKQFRKVFPLPPEGELKIGREDGSEIHLPRESVSRLHAKLHCSASTVMIEDCGSRNGVVINNERLEGSRILADKDKILIGEFAILYQEGFPNTGGPQAEGGSPTSTDTNQGGEMGGADQTFQAPPDAPSRPAAEAAPAAAAPAADATSKKEGGKKPRADEEGEVASNDPYVRLRSSIHRELILRMDLRQLNINELESDEVRTRTQRVVEQIIYDFEGQGKLPKSIDKRLLLKDVLDEALGLGPLEDLLADESVSEIMVNHKDQIYIERKGKLTLSEKKFISEAHVRSVIERIVAPIGRRIDESSPMVDARLKDGSRVNAMIPPLALKGSNITIRKFSKDPLTVNDLVKFGSFTPQMADFFRLMVQAHLNILISGGTGSGKTTLLNVMSSFIGDDERIVTIEDAAELQMRQSHVVTLESRPPNIEGKGQVTIRDLVRNALRMRPDRIVVGECRGGEALDMLQAMNTGHDGSMTTGHANTPRDMLARMETMVLMAGMDLPVRAIREQVAGAIHIIVQQSRLSDGSRKVVEVAEVTGMEGEIITMQTIFKFAQEGFDQKGKIVGRCVPSGFIPSFVEKLRAKGVTVPLAMFQA